MVHASWYLQLILNLHISSYLYSLLRPFFRWHPTVAESEVVEMENSTLMAQVSCGKTKITSAPGKVCYHYCYHLTYRLQIIKQPQLVLLIKQHPSIPLEFFIFPTFWGTVKSTSSPANPSCKVRRTSWHSSEGITFAAEFSAVHLWLAVPASVAEESVETGTERGVKTWQWIVEVVKTNQNRSLIISFEEKKLKKHI